MTRAKTLIVGLGNPILGDDGVGWRVAEAVAAALAEPGDGPAPAAEVEVDCLSLGGLSLMERLIGYERAIIVDSIQTTGGENGAVYRFPLDALPDRSAGHTTAAHDTSLQTALALGHRMGADLPEEVLIVAVEAERVFDFCDDLSPEVAAAVPGATRAVLELLT
ncbi:MAG: hydrogenase maturation protease [Candidatus Promineifilaceae bacterium]|nr:hydrogenase maturation protease [Candidatus Promineifilaceae bacterium]